jgi:Ser/Thr protein kinase RdoA (MazF antagonist)
MESPRPLALTPEVLLSEVAAPYDLAPPLTCARIYTGFHEIYRIDTGRGPLILKLFRAGSRTPVDVQCEIDVLLHLGRKGVSVSLPVAGRDGSFTQLLPMQAGEKQPAGERHAVLFTNAPGGAVSIFDEARCRLYGRALAGIHTATDDFTGAPVRWDLEQLLDLPLRALEPLLDDRPEDRRTLQEFARRLRERLAALPQEALDWGFCHGDFRAANSHLDEATGVLTTFDFEGGGIGYRAYDFATFWYFLTGGRPREEQERLAAAFMDGYGELRAFGAVQREAVALFVPVRPFRIMGNIVQSVHQNWDLEPWKPPQVPGLPSPAFFDQMLQFLREWEAARG